MNWKYNNPKFEYEEKFQDLSWPWSGHKFFAYDLVSNIKPSVIVELGTHYGTSLWSFCQAVKDNKLQTKLFSVDTWKGEKHAGFYGEEVFETVNDIKDKYYNGVNLNLRRMTFDDALKDFEDNSIDVLHIDGLHTYEAVKHDFENWIPKVKEGGIVLFHDIMVNRDDFGVYKLWEELKNNYKTIEFQFSYGLGILIKGDNSIYENKNELTNHYAYFLSDFEKEELNKKDFVIKQTAEVNNLKQKEIEEIKKIAEEKETIITEQEEEIKDLKNSIFLKENEINALKNSTSWKITKPIRLIKNKISRLKDLNRHAFVIYKKEGLVFLYKKIKKFFFKKAKNLIFKYVFFLTERSLRVLSLTKKGLSVLFKEGVCVFIKKIKVFIYKKKYLNEQSNELFDGSFEKINNFSNNIDDSIVIISHNATKTGAPLLALNVAKSLKINFKKNVIIILLQGGPLEEEFKKYGSVINLFHVSLTSISGEEEKNSDYLFKELSKQGINKCICNTVLSGMLMPFLYKYNFSTISLVHEQSGSIKKYNYTEATDKVLSYTDKIVFSSKFVKNDFEKNFKKFDKEVIVRPQGIYLKNIFENKEEAHALLRKKLNIQSNSKIIFGCGYGDLRKGVDLFFETAKQITSRNEELQCYFIWMGEWDNSLKDKLVKEAKEKGFYDKIILVDFQNDPSLFFAGADIFMLSSREDPFPSVVLNAMDCGTPVIAFDKAGGIPEILLNQQGVIVPYLDTVAVKKEILNLLKNKELYKIISEKSKKAVKEKFNFDNYVKFLLEHLPDNNREVFLKSKNLKSFRVSVIIPNYNYENFLEERLYSVINQTHKPFEIIFLDDNSQDNSVALAKKILATTNIPYKIIKNNVNKGCFNQWKKGVFESSGDLVWIAEADDSCDCDLLKCLVDKFKYPEVGLAYAQSIRMDSSGQKGDHYLSYLESIPGSGNRWRSDYINSGKDEICNYLCIENTIVNASAVLMRRDLLLQLGENIGGGLKLAGDWFTYVKVLQNSKIAFCSKILNYHRYHDKNIVNRSGKISEEKSKQLISEVIYMHSFISDTFIINKKRLNIALDHLKLICRSTLFQELDFFSEYKTKINKIYKINLAFKKRILFFSTNVNWGGSEVACAKLAQGFSASKWDTALVMNEYRPRPELLNEIILHKSITLLEKKDAGDYCRSSGLINFVKNFNPDIIFISQGHAFEAAEFMRWCKNNKFKYVNFIPLVAEYHLPVNNHQLIDENRSLLKESKQIFLDNHNAKDIMKKMFDFTFNNFQVIRNGFDVNYHNSPVWRNKDDKYFKLIYIGRLDFIHKGLDLLLEVLSMEKWKDRPLQIMAYGEGSDRIAMEKYIIKNNIKNFFFCGYVKDLEKEIVKYDGAIFPSRMEGIPIALTDVLLCHRMAIVTPVGGMPEFVKDGVTGFVADDSTVKGLDECMEKAWEKRNEWQKMGENAGLEVRKLVPEFPQQTCVNLISKIVE